jgi:AraC-like DNA-binding protein
MQSVTPIHLKTIAEYHQYMELPKPQHPLVTVVRFEDIKRQPQSQFESMITEFYCVALKKNFNGKLKYGQNEFDFDEGVMHFMAPKQLLTIESPPGEPQETTGWLLHFHPDFLWKTTLARKIRQYEFFSYKVTEALHLSEKEETMIGGIMENIGQECRERIDNFSQSIIIAHIELLLAYIERYYQRQFITRRIVNHRILTEVESLLVDYFKDDSLIDKGMPTVQYIADSLNISPNYLSRLLKDLTGQSTRQFIHDKVIEIAKEKLSTTDLSVNEIAYALGFEHPQSFNKLFKSKTNVTPLRFRQSFN